MPDLEMTPAAGLRPTAASISRWIVSRLAAELHVEPSAIDVDLPLTHLGLSSVHALSITCDLVDWLGRDLPADLIWQHPTVARLARHLALGGPSPAAPSPLRVIQPGGSQPPLILIPPAATSVVSFYPLAKRMGADQPVYGLDPLGLEEGEAPCDRIEEMAAIYVREIEDRGLEGPYCIAGRCFGGLVALEVAQQLLAGGRQVALLAVIDTLSAPLPADATRVARALNRSLRISEVALKHFYSVVRRRSGSRPERLMRRQNDVLAASEQARARYFPRRYPGRLHLIQVSHRNWFKHQRQRITWSALAGQGIEIHLVHGNHHTLCKEPHVGVLAERLRSCMDESLDALPQQVA